MVSGAVANSAVFVVAIHAVETVTATLAVVRMPLWLLVPGLQLLHMSLWQAL